MTDELLLTCNAGSSSIKLGVHARSATGARRLGRGQVDLRQKPLTLRITEGEAIFDLPLGATATGDLHEVIGAVLGWLAKRFPTGRLAAVGHRVVHGGDRFAGPERVTDEALAAIVALTPFAPLHQPHSIRLIRAIQRLRPGLPQVASFDTAFHRTQSDLVRRFALPRAEFDAGIKRYGFHGLSYQSIAAALARQAPDLARGRIVVAHLGSGASLCALEAGVSRDTSMGFSTLDGVPMATRCGALDAGVVLHLIQQRGLAPDAVEDMLYQRSGLLGVSGISADSRTLLASPAPEAREALDLFAFRIAGEVARLATTLGGLNGIVFTAGIGEHQPAVREAVCRRLAWLGVALDPAANAGNAGVVGAAESRVAVLVVPTDEEQVIADEALSILHPQEPVA